MGILNVTPDSFSDGGLFTSKDAIVTQIESMVAAGVDIIDVGGESTRPGASPVSLEVELERVLPVIDLIKAVSDVAISIDTYKTEVMQESIGRGVDMINDVNALQSVGAIEVVANANIPVCLMHKKGTPLNMQAAPEYQDVVSEVTEFLVSRAQVCERSGVLPQNIILDPGFGFGKTLEHNVALFKDLKNLVLLPYPVLVGVSRKRMIGRLAALSEAEIGVDDRLCGSVSASIVAASKGAKIIRVHDVLETVQALRVAAALW
ncbi:MAG: dihydropteroate synthase [Thiotrichales bacterium]|nr:dihydropteroate synthase [Thiotrichales bacterium]